MEEKMVSENSVCCEEKAEMRRELEMLREEVEMKKHVLDCMENEKQYLQGMIAGLKYVIRCNGISGTETSKMLLATIALSEMLVEGVEKRGDEE